MSNHSTMSFDRAVEINGRLTQAYLIREDLRQRPVPLFLGISFKDAEAAADRASVRLPAFKDGPLIAGQSKSDLIRGLYTWALLQRQMANG